MRGSASNAACKRALDRAGFRRRDQLRPRQIDLQKLVGHHAARRRRRDRADDGRRRARNPSFALSARAIAIDRPAPPAARLRLPPPETRKRAAASVPLRGRKVRNVSRISPSSKRAMHGDQRVVRLIAQRFGEGNFLLCGRAPQHRSGRAEMRDQLLRQRSTSGTRSSSLASTICTSVDQPSDRCRESRCETRSAPCLRSVAGSRPRTRMRRTLPIRRAPRRFSNTNVSDGSSRMVRSSFTRAVPLSAGSNHDGCASRGRSLCRVDFHFAHAAHQQIAVLVDVAAHALLARAAARDSFSPLRRNRFPARRRCATMKLRAKLSTIGSTSRR